MYVPKFIAINIRDLFDQSDNCDRKLYFLVTYIKALLSKIKKSFKLKENLKKN